MSNILLVEVLDNGLVLVILHRKDVVECHIGCFGNLCVGQQLKQLGLHDVDLRFVLLLFFHVHGLHELRREVELSLGPDGLDELVLLVFPYGGLHSLVGKQLGLEVLLPLTAIVIIFVELRLCEDELVTRSDQTLRQVELEDVQAVGPVDESHEL